MSTFQSVTKQDIREINTGFSLFCTEEKSKSNSTSPMKARKVFKAKRRNGNNNNNQQIFVNNGGNGCDKFDKMSNSEYVQYQKETMPKRMQRKRKFDEFSSGSNSSLHEMLENSNTFRVPYHAMFYVRVDNENNSQLNKIKNNNKTENKNKNKQNNNNLNKEKNNQNQIEKKPKCAFKMLLNGSKAINDWKVAESQLNIDNDADHDEDDSMDIDGKMDQDDNNNNNNKKNNNNNDLCSKIISENNGSFTFYPVFEECLITRSVRVSSEWVTAYNNFDFANNMAWKQFNSDGKIHEYQINRSHGIILLNLDETKKNEENNMNKNKNIKSNFLKQNENDIKQWVLDHGYSGFICNSCFYLFQPHLYWNLLDDNKISKIKQTLISDIFQSTKTKPTQNTFRFHTTF